MTALGGENGNSGNGTATHATGLYGELFQTPPLELAEEQKLLRLAKEGDRNSRDQLILANMLLVAGIARKHSFGKVEFDDLVQEGVFGLIRAIEKYDFNKGKKFSTYAYWWIFRSIRRTMEEQSRLIRLPAYTETMVRRVWTAESTLRSRLGRQPRTEEIAGETGQDSEKVNYLFSISLDPVSLDRPIGEEEEISVGDLIADEMAEAPELQLQKLQFFDHVRSAVNKLDSRSAKVIRWRFGILVGRRYSLPEIAFRIGRTRQRVNQIELAAIARLKKIMRRKEFSDLSN